MNAHEFLLRKGVRKVHQPNKYYNISVAELIEFLEEYSKVRKIASIRSISKSPHNNPQTES
jgi:hypothetical protein